MKKGLFSIGALIALGIAGSAPAFACDDGHCSSRAEVFSDLLSFSQQSSCPTLSSAQALEAASAVTEGRDDLEGFKNVYGRSCSYETALAAATSSNKAAAFVYVFQSSQESSCPTLTSAQALEVATWAQHWELELEGFDLAYTTSCSYSVSLLAAHSHRQADVFANVLRRSQESTCPTLTADQALKVSQAAADGSLNPQDFNSAYNSSCNYDVSYAASLCQPNERRDERRDLARESDRHDKSLHDGHDNRRDDPGSHYSSGTAN